MTSWIRGGRNMARDRYTVLRVVSSDRPSMPLRLHRTSSVSRSRPRSPQPESPREGPPSAGGPEYSVGRDPGAPRSARLASNGVDRTRRARATAPVDHRSAAPVETLVHGDALGAAVVPAGSVTGPDLGSRLSRGCADDRTVGRHYGDGPRRRSRGRPPARRQQYRDHDDQLGSDEPRAGRIHAW